MAFLLLIGLGGANEAVMALSRACDAFVGTMRGGNCGAALFMLVLFDDDGAIRFLLSTIINIFKVGRAKKKKKKKNHVRKCAFLQKSHVLFIKKRVRN